MALTLVIVIVVTLSVLIARGAYAGAAFLAVLALPVFLFAARRGWNREPMAGSAPGCPRVPAWTVRVI
jgi:hypothetical protein